MLFHVNMGLEPCDFTLNVFPESSVLRYDFRLSIHYV